MRGFHFTVPSPSGNAGDDALAHATRELLGQVGIREWTICNLRDHVTPRIVEHANAHDLIVLGGGGLFLADTNPNEVSGWQWKCPLELIEHFTAPFAVMAVGYNVFRGQVDFPPIFEPHVAALLKHASVFSVRNSGSRNALGERHGLNVEKVQVCPCPTLLMQPSTQRATLSRSRRVGLQMAGDRLGLRVQDTDAFAQQLDRTVVGLRDRGFEPVFIDHNWKPASNLGALRPDIERLDYSALWQRSDVDRLLWNYQDLTAVIAMRGHGQMIPFGQGTPVISWISHDKLGWFLEDAGMSDWGLEVNDDCLAERSLDLLDRMTNTDDWNTAHAAAMERFRAASARTLATIQAAL